MSVPSQAATDKTSGRPRNPQISDSIIAATLSVLDDQGYQDVTFEAVARCAKTSRPAIYRRWSTRPALVLDAIATRLEVPEQPDTGCTLCDIDESLQVFLASYRQIRPDVLSALYADCATESELREQYLQTIIEPARDAVGRTLTRATNRGDLRSDVDHDLLLDLVGALVHYQAMFKPAHLSEYQAGEAIDILLQGAARDYVALVEHSEALELEHHHGEE